MDKSGECDTVDEKELINIIKSYAYNNARLGELNERIGSINIKTTATYGNLAAASGGGFRSKVEDVGNRLYELKKKRYGYAQEVLRVKRMINNSGLDEREKGLMWWIANNGKLQAYARREHIGKDNVYKIRDRAVKKILAANKPQNRV